MNILITGASGLIGSHVSEYLKSNLDATIFTPSSSEFNITNKQSVDDFFNSNKIDFVIHSAAFTDVTAAEQQRGDIGAPAWKINVEGTTNIRNASKNHACFVIYISTDMVFSGKKDDAGPYIEEHPIETNSSRLSWYGWTKAEAERLIPDTDNSAIVRISNPTRAKYVRKLDYVRKIISAYDAGKPIKLFEDQFLTLTYVNDVSEAILKIIKKKKAGIFHVSSSNLFTPFTLGVYLLQKGRKAENVVEPSLIKDFLKQPGNSARYLQYGGLEVKNTEKKLGIQLRTWQQIIDDLLETIK